MTNFILYTLGCGCAKPTPTHNPSCTVLNFRNNLFMIDCGEGTQKEMMKQRLNFNRLHHIFITHLHGDHVLGLPGLVSTLALQGFNGELVVHTFNSGISFLKEMCDFFCRKRDFSLQFEPVTSEEKMIYESSSISVRTIPLKHSIPTVGYIFEEKQKPRHINGEMVRFHNVPYSWMNRLRCGDDYLNEDGKVIPNNLLTSDPDRQISYAHISDTIFLPEIAEKIGPVDLLFHETTYLSSDTVSANQHLHSTAKQAAMIALKSGAKNLLTGHYSSRYKDLNLYAEEAREIFPNVILNHEGLILDLTRL